MAPRRKTAARDLLLPPGEGSVWHGAWLAPRGEITAADVTAFEEQAGKRLGAVLFYVGWRLDAWAEVERYLRVAEPLGIVAHVVWEPWIERDGDPLDAILDGSADAILDAFARGARSYGRAFFLRFAHEMNGNWYPWSGARNGRNGGKYAEAWRYAWERATRLGAENAVWTWAPNWRSVPDEPWNDLVAYYPGDAFVDWVGVDFFGLKWDDVAVAENVGAVSARFSLKPVMIAETSVADRDHVPPDRARARPRWIAELFEAIPRHANVRGLFWFNEDKEADWRFAAEPAEESLRACRAGVGHARFVGRRFGKPRSGAARE